MKTPEWRKSSYSNASQNCVEVADLPGATAVRDSKHPEKGYLEFPAVEWRAFLDAVKANRI